MKRALLSFFLLAAMSLCSWGQMSPNAKLRVTANDSTLFIHYRVKGKWAQIATLGVDVRGIAKTRTGKVYYEAVTGKRRQCENQYTECFYRLKGGYELDVRVYNDGVAWQGVDSCTINLSMAQNRWLMQWSDGYEGFYPMNPEIAKGQRYACPALMEFGNGIFALMAESGMTRETAGSSLFVKDTKGEFLWKAEGNGHPGWGTMIIGSLSDVVESTLVSDNSEPCKLKDTSWIKPGVASWVYWAYNHGSNDYDIIKRYTDMAVELHLPYVLIDAEWDEMKDGKTVEDAVRYATSQGVMPMIWYNSTTGWIHGAPGPKYRLNKPEDREKEFAWCESIGVKGVKIDFFAGDTNENMRYMIDLLECAARHHLAVNFHGATIPRGWQRTYPNLVSTEAVYGAEWYNNVPTFTTRAARHNATLPFTRNVIGPMDYTPCAFTDSQHPHITTHAHELALTALYESGIQHLADRPESFLSQPQEVKDYLTNLPTVWDETILLDGYPGEWVAMARRNGSVWYISGINGSDEPRQITISLKRLKRLGKHVTMFLDGKDSSQPWDISTTDKLPTTLNLRPRGGFVAVIK